jgi:hypothetical protein
MSDQQKDNYFYELCASAGGIMFGEHGIIRLKVKFIPLLQGEKGCVFMCNNANKLESLLASSKLSDMLAESKLGELIKKKEDPIEEKKHTLIFVLAIIGAIAAVAVIAYAVYRYVTPDYMDDFDDDFDDDDDLEDDLDFDATEEAEEEPETKTDENEEE